MAGPQIRLLRRERFESSFRAIFGAAHGSIPGSAYASYGETTFAGLIGSNLDVKLSRRVSLRFSPGVFLTQYGADTQRNFRFSVGPVFRFGKS
jgi:hypothetical protein